MNPIYQLRGLTFTAWVRDLRLEHCRRMLSTSFEPLGEIAYKSGYADQAAMSKAFKKKFGLAPSAYRKKAAAGAIVEDEDEDVE